MTPEVCPKCSKPVPAPAEACPACGVIFAKLRPQSVASPGLPGVRQPIQVMKTAQYDRAFSWPVAVVHAGILSVLVAVFGLGLIVIKLLPEFTAVSQLWRLAALVFLLGLGVSRGFQLGKGAWLVGSLGALLLLLGTLAYFLRAGRLPPSREVVYRPSEERPMIVQPPRICHPALPVSFPEPGPGFEPDLENQRELNQALERPNVHRYWVFSGNEGLVVAQVVKGAGHTDVSLHLFARALRRSALAPGARVLTDTFSEAAGQSTYHLAVDYADGTQMDVRCLASGSAVDPPLLFCLEGSGDSRLFFQPMLGGMALRGCEG